MKKHIKQFFKFLEDKEDKYLPLKVKIINSKHFEFTKEELIIKDNLDLSETNIKELPQGLEVNGTLNLRNCTSLKDLPQGLKVGESLNLFGCTSLEKLPQDLYVGEDLDLYGCTSLTKLPQGLQVDGSLDLQGCTSLKELSQGLKVGRSLWLYRTSIAEKYSKKEIWKMIKDGGGFVNGAIFIE